MHDTAVSKANTCLGRWTGKACTDKIAVLPRVLSHQVHAQYKSGRYWKSRSQRARALCKQTAGQMGRQAAGSLLKTSFTSCCSPPVRVPQPAL